MAAFNRQPNVLFLLPQSHASPVNRPQRRFTVRHAIPLPSGALLSVLFHESARGKWAPSTEFCRQVRPFPRALGNGPSRDNSSACYWLELSSAGCHLGRTLAAEIWASVFFPVTGLFFFLASTPEKRRDDRERDFGRVHREPNLFSLSQTKRARDLAQQALGLAISCRIPPDNPASDSALMGL